MEISVVVPVYRSAGILPKLAAQVAASLRPVCGDDFELILVNDGSPDDSWEVITDLSRRHPFLIGVDLRRNAGQDNAIMAGLQQARGRAVAIMDDDLQHSPRDIPALCARLEAGYDVCYANFPRKRQAWWKNAGSWLNGRLADWVIGKPRHIYLSPFKALTGGLAAEMVRYRGPSAYVDGVIWRLTSRCTQIPVRHHERAEGRGNYGLRRSIQVWLKLLMGFSVKPLRVITVTGFIISLLSFLSGLIIIGAYFFDAARVHGWTSLFVSIAFLCGFQLTCLGMIGEYVGRTYVGLSGLPQFSVRAMLKRGVGGVPEPRGNFASDLDWK